MARIWPAGLDDRLLYGSFAEKRRKHRDEDITDSGMPISSKKPGSPLTDISGDIYIEVEQKNVLDAFYIRECAEGTLPFQWRDPHSGTLKTFHWTGEAPGYREMGVGYRVSLQLARE